MRRACSRVLVLMATGLLLGCAGHPLSDAFKASDGAGGADGLAQIAADIESRGESGTALTLYQRAAAASGGSPSAQVQLGDAYLRAGRVGAAIDSYRAVLAKHPDHG